MKDKGAKRTGLPAWLDGQTVAIIGTVLTVGVGISAMILVVFAGIRAEIGALREEMYSQIGGLREEMYQMRTELTRRLDALDVRVRGLERTVTVIEHGMKGLESRLRVVEADRRQPLETPHLEPPDG